MRAWPLCDRPCVSWEECFTSLASIGFGCYYGALVTLSRHSRKSQLNFSSAMTPKIGEIGSDWLMYLLAFAAALLALTQLTLFNFQEVTVVLESILTR